MSKKLIHIFIYEKIKKYCYGKENKRTLDELYNKFNENELQEIKDMDETKDIKKYIKGRIDNLVMDCLIEFFCKDHLNEKISSFSGYCSDGHLSSTKLEYYLIKTNNKLYKKNVKLPIIEYYYSIKKINFSRNLYELFYKNYFKLNIIQHLITPKEKKSSITLHKASSGRVKIKLEEKLYDSIKTTWKEGIIKELEEEYYTQNKLLDKHYKYHEHSKSHRYDEDIERKNYKDNELRKNPKTKNTYLQDTQLKSKARNDFDNEKFKEVEIEDPEYILKDGTKLKYKFKYQEDNYKVKKLSTSGKEPLFTISYKRSEKACLNYRAQHFLGTDFDNRLCFLFLQEQDVEEYYEKWGGLGFIFVYIPKLQGFTDIFEDFGIGQTRRCLQVFSKYILNDLKLDYYWSFDDNIPYFWKLKDEKKGNVETSIDDFQIIEDKGTSIIIDEIVKYKDKLPEPKSTIPDIEDSIQKTMIGCFQNRGSFTFRNKLLPDLFGTRQHHVQKFLLISSKACFDKMVFYKGIGNSGYGILNQELCKKPLYSHCKEDTTFSRELCEAKLSIYKLYNFIFFGYIPGSGGVSNEFTVNEKMSENIKKGEELEKRYPIRESTLKQLPIPNEKPKLIETPIEIKQPDILEYNDELYTNSEIISKNVFYDKYYNNTKKTRPKMTKFEKAKILGIRAQMLAIGSVPFVNVPKNITNVTDIAKLELKERKIPLIIKRFMPDNTYECWRIEEMIIND